MIEVSKVRQEAMVNKIACNKSVSRIRDGIGALISLTLASRHYCFDQIGFLSILLAGVCRSRIRTVSQNRYLMLKLL